MGIDLHSAQFLQSEVRRGVVPGRMLTLGRQSIYMDPSSYRTFVKEPPAGSVGPIYADNFFHALGAKSLDAMDASAYEGAKVLHDLNEPIKPELREDYDCVFDGGALEHVFNFPQALKNCMEMVKVGGHFLTITPTSSFCGHGFYQFSPELFYAALSEENGYAVERMLLVEENQWYSVRKPAEIGERVELLTDEPTLLFVSARRTERKRIFQKWPQQSDYFAAWTAAERKEPTKSKPAKEKIAASVPMLATAQQHWRNYKSRRQRSLANRRWFEPVSLK